ncbi:glycosyl transferase [Pseudidiomarina aestuarii]|nr:glycosyl transferase [Pseudidiomarina aestuarii]
MVLSLVRATLAHLPPNEPSALPVAAPAGKAVMHCPLVSVYMPTHNRVELLKRSVASVLTQSYPAIELIVVDDASSDDTWNYLSQLAASDARVIALRNETASGACVARNKALAVAHGHYVTGLDDDDEMLPDRIQLLVSAFEDNYSFVTSGYYWVAGERAKPTMCKRRVITLTDQLNVNHATNQVLTTRERMLAIDGFDESLVALQDWDCFTRLIKAYGPALRLAEATQNIYVDHGGERISNPAKSRAGFAQFLEKHGADMNSKHRLNHVFWLKVRTGEPFSLPELFQSLRAGYIFKKVRHYMRYLF